MEVRGRSVRHRRLRRTAIVAVVALAALGAGCTPGPVAVGSLPLSGTWTSGAVASFCVPSTGPLSVVLDYHSVELDWARVEIDRYVPTTDDVPILDLVHSGLHWEFTSATVNAGDCMSLRISSGCICCDPCPPVSEHWFDYRIRQL